MLFKLVKEETRRLWNRMSGAPPAVDREWGRWHHDDLEWMAGLVRGVPGDFAEIGVFRGHAFRKVAALAHAQGRLAHAFDSFRGMAPPQPEDGERYPTGMFDIGGVAAFVSNMDDCRVEREWYRTWPGYIPDCFRDVPPDLRFSFAILDVDQYRPTEAGLAWLAPRVARGGILALDDWIPEYEGLATRAIREFLQNRPGYSRIAEFNRQLILRKSRKD